LYASVPSKAVERLQIAVPYELAGTGISFYGVDGSFGNLYPVYVRGTAYLACVRVPKPRWSFGMARLQMGRAFALAGDQVKAKSAYQDFLTLWKDADVDIPILKQARAEFAKLQ